MTAVEGLLLTTPPDVNHTRRLLAALRRSTATRAFVARSRRDVLALVDAVRDA